MGQSHYGGSWQPLPLDISYLCYSGTYPKMIAYGTALIRELLRFGLNFHVFSSEFGIGIAAICINSSQVEGKIS